MCTNVTFNDEIWGNWANYLVGGKSFLLSNIISFVKGLFVTRYKIFFTGGIQFALQGSKIVTSAIQL